jgi:hypothetical protein
VTRKSTKARKRWPGPLTQAELLKGSLPRLVHLYRQLEAAISRFIDFTEPPDPLDYLVQNQVTVALERVLLACAKAIKASKPDGPRQIEMKAALLYDHALNFEGTDKERRAILAEAMLGIPVSDSIKSELTRFPKTKLGEGGELHEVKPLWLGQTRTRSSGYRLADPSTQISRVPRNPLDSTAYLEVNSIKTVSGKFVAS